VSTTETNTQEPQSNTSLSDIEQKLALLIINTRESFVLVDKDFKIVTYNDEFEKQFINIFHRQIKKGDSIINYSQVRPAQDLVEIYQSVFKGESIESEVKLTLPDNKIHTFLIKYNPAYDESGNIFGAFVSTTDISDRVDDMERIKQSEGNLKTIFENTSEGFILLDINCSILAFNSKTKKYTFFISENEMEVGKNLFEYVQKSRVVQFQEIIAKVLQGETIQYERPYQRENSHITWIDFTITPVKEAGQIIGFCISLKDITQRVQNEVALTELYDKLNRRAEELTQSNAELESFAYVASHDMREPLRMVTSFLSRLENKYRDKLDDKAKQYIHFAVDGAARMRKIIHDLLEYSKVGKKEYKFEEIDLSKLLAEVGQLNISTFNEKNAVLCWDSLPVIYGYRTPLLQVFHNIISNSLKYQRSEVHPIIKIVAEEHIDYWKFSVTDNGIGIDNQFLSKIFVLFQRLHQKDEYSGTGIGLAICKKIIESHQGKIWAESVVGESTVVYFTIKKIYNKPVTA